MNRNQYFVTLAVDPYRVIVVLVLVGGWRELDVDLLCDAGRNHALLLVPDLEVSRLRR